MKNPLKRKLVIPRELVKIAHESSAEDTKVRNTKNNHTWSWGKGKTKEELGNSTPPKLETRYLLSKDE